MLNQLAMGESPSPTVSLQWIEPPRELSQGKVALKIRLTAEADVRLEKWVAEGWGSNFAIYISKLPENGKPTVLPPATGRGFVKFETLALKRGESRDLVGEFALNNEPGDYELIAQLPSQKARSNPIRVSVKPGQIVDIRK